MERIKYTCKKCGWKTSILAAWADLKPQRCCGKIGSNKCKTSFLKEPEALLIEKPMPKEESQKE